ncbi:MAG TPA: four-helix bundle copper-binding protein [Saprospiraceae bacterium]|nr:four-helix bundle copper-binding protein [Saprospiraceae bacterium]
MNNTLDLEACIEACLRCAAECQQCATFCLKEDNPASMAKCIQLDLECSAICYATAQLMSLGSDQVPAISKICADICELCARECDRHEVDHCQKCAVQCRACEEECRKMEFAAQG